jgi:hypothetical protein
MYLGEVFMLVYDYLEAVVKHWVPLLIGAFGTVPWWLRAMLSSKFKAMVDEYLNPSALKWLAIVSIVISFIWANSLAWKDERQSLIEAEKNLVKAQDMNTVKLECQIAQITRGLRNKDMWILLTASIWNSGADSSVRGYQAEISFEGQTFNLATVLITHEGFELYDAKGTLAKFFQSDTLNAKTQTPIKRGDFRTGVILFTMKGGAKFIDVKPEYLLLSFADYSGKIYKTRFDWKDNLPGGEFKLFQGATGANPHVRGSEQTKMPR